MTSDQYHYHALGTARSIRLVHLKEQAEPTSEIEYKLLEVPLDEAPPYCAVSYSWSNQKLTEEIICDGQKLLVTRNCKAALRQLLGREANMLWIDAMCVNQEDVDERNSQVFFMGSIFRDAQHVLVWLGEAADDSESCLASIGNDLEPSNIDVHEAKAINHLFERPWFTRVWVLQEVAVAKDVRVVCGNAVVAWDSLAAFITRMWASPVQGVVSDVYNCNDIITLRKDYIKTGSVNAFHALALSRTFEATDLRDKVYALLTVSRELGDAIGKPDYAKSVVDVWTDAMAACLQGSLGVSQLSLVSHTLHWRETTRLTGYEGLPSWVPALDHNIVNWRIWPKAKKAQMDKSSFRVDGPRLHIRGSILDRISNCQRPSWDKYGDMGKLWKAWFDDISQTAAKTSGEPLHVAFWKTIYGDIRNHIKADSQLAAWHGHIMSGKSVEDESELIGAGLRPSGRDVVIQTRQNSAATVTARDFYGSTRKGTLGLTENGTLGFFPQTTKVGDLVAYFKGSETLFVLRKVQDPRPSVFQRTMQTLYRNSVPDQPDQPTYELVGACYVHGGMAGKSWKKNISSTKFVL
jgi:hypothetical protein